MSRIGKLPITIPSGVSVNIKDRIVSVTGNGTTLHQKITSSGIDVEVKENEVLITRATEQKRHKSMHGLYRQLINNMVIGVSKGFKLELELHGVGYRASNKGQLLELAVGYSHPIMFYIPDEVKVTTEMKKGDPPRITLESADKQLVGQVAAKIRSFRKPEPYKGKGVRFRGEQIRRKAGKTAAK